MSKKFRYEFEVKRVPSVKGVVCQLEIYDKILKKIVSDDVFASDEYDHNLLDSLSVVITHFLDEHAGKDLSYEVMDE